MFFVYYYEAFLRQRENINVERDEYSRYSNKRNTVSTVIEKQKTSGNKKNSAK